MMTIMTMMVDDDDGDDSGDDSISSSFNFFVYCFASESFRSSLIELINNVICWLRWFLFPFHLFIFICTCVLTIDFICRRSSKCWQNPSMFGMTNIFPFTFWHLTNFQTELTSWARASEPAGEEEDQVEGEEEDEVGDGDQEEDGDVQHGEDEPGDAQPWQHSGRLIRCWKPRNWHGFTLIPCSPPKVDCLFGSFLPL